MMDNTERNKITFYDVAEGNIVFLLTRIYNIFLMFV